MQQKRHRLKVHTIFKFLGIVFGGDLETLAKLSGDNIPLFLRKSIEYIESSGGVESQGIYRLSGNASTVQKYRTQVNQCNMSFLTSANFADLYVDSTDVNVIAALVKRESISC
jgi:hypothetical protein